jgi:hypothetical protein
MISKDMEESVGYKRKKACIINVTAGTNSTCGHELNPWRLFQTGTEPHKRCKRATHISMPYDSLGSKKRTSVGQ